ncbi:MAG TPA: restriction endonuclease, partial [Polyangia bacterium]|nr:restriction endonuclease [Polyangia bacterium]
MATLSKLLESLSSEVTTKGRQFEKICKWYLLRDPKYAGQLRKVWLWNEWPGRRGPDTGIDLVAETVDGKLWAIQCKAYSPTITITKADLDTFLSESSRAVFSHRLLIATTDRIGANARRTIEGQEKPVGLLLMSDL